MVRMQIIKTLVVLMGLWITPTATVVAESINSPVLAQTSALDEANQLERQSAQFYQQGKYSEAIPLAEKVLELRRKVLKAKDPLVADALNNLALIYVAQGRHHDAEPLYQESIAIDRQSLSLEHPQLAIHLSRLANLYQTQGRYAEAEPLLKEALAIIRKAFPPNHPYLAATLSNLAMFYQAQGRYANVDPLLQEALAIAYKALPSEHPHLAIYLNNLAELYRAQGRYSDAEPLYQKALAITQKALPLNQANIIISLNNLAELYREQGRYSDAEPLYQNALSIAHKYLPPDHPLLANQFNSLAELRLAQGRYIDAETLHQKSLSITRKSLPPNHPNLATTLSNLALVYQLQGYYKEAEPLHKEALSIARKSPSFNHHLLAIFLNKLASLYQEQGRYSEAEPLQQESISIARRYLPPNHPHLATNLGNLAVLFQTQGHYSKAESLYQEILSIDRKFLPENHPQVSTHLANLANLYQIQGRYGEAQVLYKKAVTIDRQSLFPGHIQLGIHLNNLALLYQAQEDYSEAKNLYQEFLSIASKSLPDDHPHLAVHWTNLATLYWIQQDLDQTLLSLNRSLDIEETNLTRNLSIGSEQQKRDYLAQFQSTTNTAISFHLQQAPNNPQVARLALTTILRRKGRILSVLGQSFQKLRQIADPKTLSQLNQLQDLYNQRSLLASRGPTQLPPQAYQQQLQTLQNQTQQLEDILSRSSAEIQQQFTPVQIEQVQEAIPTNAVLVEFILYQPLTPKAKHKDRFGPPRYAVYLLTPKGDIRWADLGLASDLKPLIKVFRQSIADDSTQVSKRQQLAQALYQKLFQPIRSLVGNAQHLLIAPDGPLNLIPFEALVDDQNQYLLETYQITYLSSGRDLLRLNLPSPQTQPPLLIANPDYGSSLKIAKAPTDSDPSRGQQRSSDLTQSVEPLSGTALEGTAIAKLIPKSRLLTETQASESAIKQSPNPSLLHIATHGFFLADRPLPQSTDSAALRIHENPLLRSGLALAGFNRRQDANQDDGVLTALEISGLDFRATQQVTLSACETGLGDVVTGEGVYGLRRAFTLAGAQSQLMSLWKVNDTATKNLMVAYYQRLQQGQPRGDALRQVQLQMLKGQLKNDKGETYEHPYFWAAFVRTGDWRPLQKF